VAEALRAADMDNAGRITGNLTPECAAAVQAVLEALGKKRGPEGDRTAAQQLHDALQETCYLRGGLRLSVRGLAAVDVRDFSDALGLHPVSSADGPDGQ
jgi:hypothetical protein